MRLCGRAMMACVRRRRAASQRRRFDYRRKGLPLEREGIKIGSTPRSVWRCVSAGGRKRALGTRAPMTLQQGRNQRWSLDFVGDTLARPALPHPDAGRRLYEGVPGPGGNRSPGCVLPVNLMASPKCAVIPA
jgi:hypothetical protein